MTTTEPAEPASEALSGGEVRKRAVAGAAVVGARGIAINILAFLGNVAFARLLVPEDYGTIALGQSILMLATFLADGGLGAALVRRPQAPARDDLRAFMALQLGGSMTICLLALAIGVPLGGAGPIVAIMLASLPIVALRGPAKVVLERELDFRPLAAVEVGESVAYYAFGIAAVAAGLGVHGLAAASVVKAVAGTALLARARWSAMVTPLPSVRLIRPMLRFGVQFQGVQVVSAVRDQGIGVAIAAVSGSAALALWTVAWRLLQVPFLLFQTLWHVSFPAMAQLLAGGEDPRPVIERLAGLAAVGTGVILTMLAGSTPALVPALFGDEYADARAAIPWVCGALQVAGPVSVATAGYLFASGRTGVALRAAVIQVAIWFAIGLSLLPSMGVEAIGIGFAVAALTETVIFTRTVDRAADAKLLPELWAPFLAAAAGAACGWLVAGELGQTIWSAIASGAVALVVYATVMLVVRRALVIEVAAFARRSAASLVGR